MLKRNLLIAGFAVRKYFPLYWAVLALLMMVVDYVMGPDIQFSIVFLVPVALASWYNGKRQGFMLAAVLPVVRFAYAASWHTHSPAELSINLILRVSILCVFAMLFDRAAIERRSMTKRIKVLEGIVPICSACKKIRNDHQAWESLEKYISEHSEAHFTHGICPECVQKLYGEYLSASARDVGPEAFEHKG